VLRDGQGRVPSFDLGTPGQDIHLTFAGLPMGHEFTSLVLALLQVGGHPSKATAELIEQVQNLEGDAFETYFSLSCQNCPDVVQALNLAAVLNPRIQHVAIDGALFQDEVEREIMSVPTVYLNGEVFDQGRMTLEQIVAKLDTNASKRDAEDRRQGRLRRAGGRRWPGRRGSGDLCRARASAPASPPSASAARCWTPWRSRTSFR
jgi:alkyl hydroperoxide reductase subunit F